MNQKCPGTRNPNASVSAWVGSTRCCARVKKGLLEVRNVRASGNKLRFAYVLTPRVIDAKARLTAGFLRRKMAEYEALGAEIEALGGEMKE